MSYKETLYFIAKCLTISYEDNNRQEIKQHLKSKSIDWDSVVKLSTGHYIFPAIYCNFKRANFLKYLPYDLVAYMKHITNLNRVRNRKIIRQAKDLNSILIKNGITPIFIKGAGNLLEGLYEDIGERMVGDIDFIINKNQVSSLKKILVDFGYKTDRIMPPSHRHESTMVNENYIASVEVHKELLIEKYKHEFHFNLIYEKIQKINGVMVLGFDHQLALSIISHQINDFGYEYKILSLRNAYDVFLLSKKTNPINAINNFNKLNHPLNCFLAVCYEIFNNADCLVYNKNKKTLQYLDIFREQLSNLKKTKRRHRLIKIYIFIKSALNILNNSLSNKEYRVWLCKILLDKNWYKQKLIMLGLKKYSL